MTTSERISSIINEVETKIISANAEGFIVPNHAAKVKDFLTPSVRHAYRHLAQDNNVPETPDYSTDRAKPYDNIDMTQMWFASDDECVKLKDMESKTLLHSENLVDHGFTVSLLMDGNEYTVLCSGGNFRFIPSYILKDVREGDHFHVKSSHVRVEQITCKGDTEFNLAMEDYLIDHRIHLMIDLEVIANQRDYRYGRFGTFQEVFHKVHQ